MHPGGTDRGRSLSPLHDQLLLPKNRSTGNLLAHAPGTERARIRFSFDAGMAAEYDTMSRSVFESSARCWICLEAAHDSGACGFTRYTCWGWLTRYLNQILGHDRTRPWDGCLWSAADPAATSNAATTYTAVFRIVLP
jgi:hypothetical protein